MTFTLVKFKTHLHATVCEIQSLEKKDSQSYEPNINTVNNGLQSYILNLMKAFGKYKRALQKDGLLLALISLVRALYLLASQWSFVLLLFYTELW